MKAVVLACGEGTRLKPLTYKRPKPLIPVAGRPCIDYVLRSLAASGFHEIIVTTAYLSDTLIKSIGDGLDYNASIVYSFEENHAGSAGDVRRAGVWMDIGRPHDLWKASMEVVRREGKPLRRAGVKSEGPVILDPAARVDEGVTIRGPCYVGANAVLRSGSLVDNACLYESARVEGNAVVRNSIVLEGSVIGAAAEILDSVISRGCVIEEGARIAASIIGDMMTIRAGSRLENATVSQPP